MAQQAARVYWRFTLVWLITGSVLGILCALSLLAPDFLKSNPILSYGRLVAAHRASIIYGVLFSGVFATGYSLLPRLTGARFLSPWLSMVIAWTGEVIVILGVVAILLGFGSGREYSDLPLSLGFIYWVYLIYMAGDFGTMIARSKSLGTHPATGFISIATILPAVVYIFALPDWWGSGVFDALRTWISWRTIFISVFGASALGLAIWYIGSIRPAVKLQTGAFVLAAGIVVGFAPLMGIVHLLDAPMAVGLKSLGAFSAVMVGCGLIVFSLILWRGGISTPPALLFIGSLMAIIIVAVQGIVMVIPPFHTAFHFTSNTSAHAHLALGALVLLLMCGGLVLIPRLSMTPLPGNGKYMKGAGFMIAGLVILVLFMVSAGVIQASAFSKGLSAPDWLPMYRWLHLGVLIGGVVMLIGELILIFPLSGVLRKPLPAPLISEPEIIEPEEEPEQSVDLEYVDEQEEEVLDD